MASREGARHFHRDRNRSRDRSRSSERRRSLGDRKQRPGGHKNNNNNNKNNNNDRSRRDETYKGSPSSNSGLTESERHPTSARRRKNRSSYEDDDDSGEDTRRKRRRRRRSPEKQPQQHQRGGGGGGRSMASRRRSASPPRHRRNNRDYDESSQDNRRRRHERQQRQRSMGRSSSPDTRRRGQRRRRRRSRGGRRAAAAAAAVAGGSVSSDSARPQPVAADVPPRAGVVSVEDEGAAHAAAALALLQQHELQQELKPETRKAKAPPPASSTNKKKRSASSSHDDNIGHFKGREGVVISDRYRVIKEVGVGTFGRVLECLDLKRTRSSRRDRQENAVAIKIVRNVKRYYESALIEADIVEEVNRRGGRGVSHCAVMFDSFSFSGHYCMVFEKLGPSLYDFLKRQKYRPFPLMVVRDFAKQLLETLEFLHSFRLIHTDLKPENVLLMNGREVSYKGHSIPECTRIKVIDFGGATYDNEKKSSVVNTRQYRAPEVILGVGWSMPSDLWSVGCILAELYQGELLFATHDNIEHLALIEQVVGPFPRRMLKRAKNAQLANEAFDNTGAHRMERVLPPESLAYVKRVGPLESIMYEEDTWFLRLLRRILVTDPDERATARECLRKF